MEIILEGKSNIGPLEKSPEELRESGIPRASGPMKMKMVRAYPMGSLVDQIHRCENLEEFEGLWAYVQKMAAEKRLPARTVRRLNAAGKVKHAELKVRLIIRPPKLVIPQHNTTPAGIILP